MALNFLNILLLHCDIWLKVPNCYTVWFSGKIIAFQTHRVTFCFVARERSKQMSSEGVSWSWDFNKMDLLLPLTRSHNSPQWGWLCCAFQIELHIKPIWISCPSLPPPRVSLHICQAAQIVTHQATAWPLVSGGRGRSFWLVQFIFVQLDARFQAKTLTKTHLKWALIWNRKTPNLATLYSNYFPELWSENNRSIAISNCRGVGKLMVQRLYAEP